MNPDPKTFYNKRMPGKLGPDYEQARWHGSPLQEAQYAMMTEVMRRVASLARNAKAVLEIGPGQGTWTKFLLDANANARFTLVDISAEMLARAKASLPHGFAISFAESDILAYAPPEPFDFIFSSRAIEYVPDKTAVAQKLASLLAPGGTLILITKLPKRFFDFLSGRKLSSLHGGQIAPHELSALLLGAGFYRVKIRMATATVPGFGSPFLNRLAFKAFSRLPLYWPLSALAESYLLIAKKAL
ncbi:class I SAM-dependent methyltransferase [Candidatus Kaiserbacteria bacterium]|nr:class I SAM-dependent methyltransferase [Candidatus Kaiserbacteria bacterium]